MKMFVFSIRDHAVEAYGPPFFMRSKDEAIRTVIQALGDPSNPFIQSPDDYTLYAIGGFDNASGLLVGDEPKRVYAIRELLAMMKEKGAS